MDENPQVWHYGLMAERWAEFIRETPEFDFYLAAIRRFGQPVLDLACGVGRVMLPLLRAGIEVDGCDISADMLEQCRRITSDQGFHVNLYQQAMHEFKLPRRYRTIYICGSIGLGGGRKNDLATLNRCYNHLEPGGALVLNIQADYTDRESWEMWLPDFRKTLPEPWPKEGSVDIAPDGSEHRAWFRTLEIDPLEQTFMREVHLEKRVGGSVIASEEYILKGNMYFKNEMVLMLNAAGFENITVTGDYSNEPATAESEELVFTSIRSVGGRDLLMDQTQDAGSNL